MQQLKGSQTEKNLASAFARESEIQNTYLYYAEKARHEDQVKIADAFEAIAANEAEHARKHFELLRRMDTTEANLKKATNGEHFERTEWYPSFAKTAREEGFTEIADIFDHMARAEARHENICHQILEKLATGSASLERTVGHSAVKLAELTLPHQANPAGFVHGGELMKMMDSAAAVVAFRHAQTNVVTGRVENIRFVKPVRVGDLVTISANLTFVSHSSMEVGVEVETEILYTGQKEKALTAYFVMVALDPEGNAVLVPPLMVTTEAEERLFEEGRLRYESFKKRNS